MSDKLHLGWLQTRDQENYAPKTVIEGVYQASSGKLYDKVIKEYIDNKVKDINPTVATLQTTVATHTTEISNLKSADNALNSSIDAIEKSIENIQDDGSDALYITDNSGYKIAQIDKYGIHSVEVHNKDTSLGAVADRMVAAETQLSNIADGDLSANDDTFYIIDKDDYIIAKIDQDGITSTDFIIKNGEEFSSLLDLINNNQSGIITLRNELQKALDALAGRVSSLETSVSEIRNVIDTSDDDSNDTFYIIDKDDNIIAKIDQDGVHSVDFTVEDKGSNNIVSLVDLKVAYDKLRDNKDTSIDTRLSSLKTELNTTISAHTTTINEHEGKLTTLIGADTNKSVKDIAKDVAVAEVATIISDADPSDIDTLEEIAQWIINDKTGAAAISNQVAANKTNIENHEGRIGAVETTIPTLQEAVSKLDNIDVSIEEGKIVITDDTEDSNKIVEIDDSGVKSVDFIIDDNISLNKLYNQFTIQQTTQSGINQGFNDRLDIIQGNSTVKGSIANGVQALKDELVNSAKTITNFKDAENAIDTKLSASTFNTYQTSQAEIDSEQNAAIENRVTNEELTAYDEDVTARMGTLRANLYNIIVSRHDIQQDWIDDHETRLITLESNETVENSVRYLIKQLEEAVINGALTYKDFKAIEDKLNQQDNILNLDETSNAFYIIDKNENVIFRVDNQGVSTTGLFASNLTFNNNYNMQLNGVFVDSDKLKDIEVEFDIED